MKSLDDIFYARACAFNTKTKIVQRPIQKSISIIPKLFTSQLMITCIVY